MTNTTMTPQIFELAVLPDGTATPGHGVLAAVVPSAAEWLPVVVMSCDPRHEPGRPIAELASATIGWLYKKMGIAATGICWAVIDNDGRYSEVLPDWSTVGSGGTAPMVQFRRFPSGSSTEAFFRDVGAGGEAAIELLSTIIEKPSQEESSLSARTFLDAVSAHGKLPTPGMIFRKVEAAAENGDLRAIANAIQTDPATSASLINSANAARFAACGLTASVPQAVTRLGTSFVRRIVFVAEMMARYQKGACPGFNYRGYWLNAIATGAAMRALLPEHKISEQLADDAFSTGLMSGIGWLVVAETFPDLMTRYLARCQGADPITKARAQREIFPSEIYRVSDRYLQRFAFPEVVRATIAGDSAIDRQWYDALARALRAAQGLAPFDCVAIPTTVPVPEACREEWQRWQSFLSAPK
ncbi:MAG: HDOD domain-containing protein [Gammaproteobacteria bacterium]|nr:HDOD domain-containing protein [Gammaproteobacteria bacterium]MBU4005417.1 HDOD domain-containing protein [Gammaproteobacteria bacterium]MBU4022709.1 HDOD domain-containing protein [Gammaproteobacteria bacterium]MBU4097209.1 HDOD domain-containing protein [Gammaproteobacteria bacterium]MBU4147001.1 HDOD domain-containing protein [Gammaproteobacteria bacterium]